MSTQPLQQCIEVSRQVMANVTPEQMQNQTPCASWDVAGLINHMVGAQHFWVGPLKGEAPSGDELPDFAAGDWMGAFDQASAGALEAFQAEGALDGMVKAPFGEMPGTAWMGLAMNDTFTHAWDLAKATGQDTNLAPELAQAILAQAQQAIPDAFRGDEGAPFGPQAECADDACAADQLAAFLGRQV